MVGDISPSEKSTFNDPHTGAAITQYTNKGETNRTLYFTNRTYTVNDEYIIFLSDRTGRNEMFALDRKTGKIIQLTDTPGQSNFSNCIHPTRPELYFTDKQRIYRISLDNLKTEELLTAPPGHHFEILNFNAAPWLAVATRESKPRLRVTRPGVNLKPAVPDYEGYYQRALTIIYRYNVDDDRLECLYSDCKLLSHIQLSPANPDLLIFSSWRGYGEPRMQYVPCGNSQFRDTQPIFPENDRARGSHECFTRKGNLYCQWMEGDFREPGDKDIFHAFLNCSSVATWRAHEAPFKRYRLPERDNSLVHHYTVSLDETWLLHDRWIGQPNQEQNVNFMSLIRHQDDEPQTRVERLCFTNSYWDLYRPVGIGPDACLSKDDTRAAYTSWIGQRGNICEVDLRPFIERLFT